jgi:hypothetical protein
MVLTDCPCVQIIIDAPSSMISAGKTGRKVSGARSTIEVLDPPRRFAITDLSQVPLSGWEIGMSQYDFAHDFDGNTGSRCISGRMPPEIVRPQFDAGELSCFLDDNPGGRIRDRKNPLLRLKRSLLDVSTQTLHHLSRNEDNLSVLTALWTLCRQLMVAYTNLRSSEYQKKLKSSGSFAPQTPSQLRCSIWRCGGRPAKSCGVRGSHFPALFDYFNLERNFVQDGI